MQPPIGDTFISLIRTGVPILVGSLIAWLATSRHIVVSADASAAVGVFATAICSAAYYGIARLLESVRGAGRLARVARRIGNTMLGSAGGPPTYTEGATESTHEPRHAATE